MQDSTFIVLLTFVCLMTGIYPPGTVIRSRFPSKVVRLRLYNSMMILFILVTGLTSFFNQLTGEITAPSVSAFIFFDGNTNEKLAVYQATPTNFSNHLFLEVQEREVIDSTYVQLDIMLTNQLKESFIFNPEHLYIIDEKGTVIAPAKSWIEHEPTSNSVLIQPETSVLGTFLYLKSPDDINFQLKYLPILP